MNKKEIGKKSIDILENRISELELEKNLKIKNELYSGECESGLCFYKGIDWEIKRRDKIIDLMAIAIENLDSQSVLCKYKSKGDVIKYFEEKAENGDIFI